MPQYRNNGRPVFVRREARARPVPGPPPGNGASPPQDPPNGTPPPSKPALEAARRAVESVIVAVVASTGLYLVGSVYVDAYFGRLSIEATSLDLAPPFVALQSIHALQGLLGYPSTLLTLYILYRTFSPVRRLRGWFERARHRFPRLLPVLANLAVVAPLLVGAVEAIFEEQDLAPRSVLTEATGVLVDAGLVLLVYAVWLGWSQRLLLVSEIRAHRLAPIALVFIVYLLNALASTAATAERAAELLLTGDSDASLRVVFTMRPGVEQTLAGKELILVTARNGTYYVVEQQPFPPSQRPTAYMVAFGAVDTAQVQRLNDADATLVDFVLDEER